jgi:hypothetical protein
VQNIIAQVLPWLKRAAAEGVSANRALTMLRERGLGIRRQRFLSIYRELRGVEAKRDRLKYVPHKYAPSRELYVTLPREGMKTRYGYTVRYDVIDPEGRISSKYFSVRSERQLTVRESLETVANKVKPREEKYENKFLRAVIEQAFHREGEMWD